MYVPDRARSRYSLLPREFLEHEAADDHVEEDGGEDETGAPPPVVAVHQPLGEGGEEECSDAGAANCDARGKAPLGLEVVSHDDNGGDVAEAQPESRYNPKEEIEKGDVVRKGCCQEAQRG